MQDLQTGFAGLGLEHPVMNAAGTCKVIEGKDGVRELARSAVAAIVVGSVTVQKRPGNDGTNYNYDSDTGSSVNSIGLKNPGMEEYKTLLPEMLAITRDAGKPLILSVAGFSPEEYATLAEFAVSMGVDAIELNLGCPNVWGDGGQKPIASFHHMVMDQILDLVEERIGIGHAVGVKLSPYSDPTQIPDVARLLTLSPIVEFIACCNTFPNAFDFRPDWNPAIDFGAHLGGGAGRGMQVIGLGQVQQFKTELEKLNSHIDIIGVGGVTYGRDVLKYMRAGANAVGVATAFLEAGSPEIFSTMLEEYVREIERAENLTANALT